MKIKSIIALVAIIVIFISTERMYSQSGITFTVGNSTITTDGTNEYYEFDILAAATGNNQFKLAQVYIDYNTAGFGSSIFTSGNVTVTAGELLNGTLQGIWPDFGTGSYTITLNDNTSSKLSIANDFAYIVQGTYTGAGYELSNQLGTTPKVYVRVKIKIQNPAELSGISLDAAVNQFELQQYYYTTPGTDNQVNYSPVTVGSGLNEPLPVELTSFTANVKGDETELNWKTATEINNYGFEILRSSKNDKFKKIGFVEGAGNSISPKSYRFVDNSFSGGTKFKYRLKQIDNDGTFEYSDIVEVEIVPDKFMLYQNYPNPFNPTTKIKFNLPEAADVNLSIYNTLGEFITTLADEKKDAGYYEYVFEGVNLSSGIYIYRLVAGNKFVSVKKMILLR